MNNKTIGKEKENKTRKGQKKKKSSPKNPSEERINC